MIEPLTRFQNLFEQNSITECHNLLETNFKSFYREANYVEALPESLISEKDPSVLFTGATISALKDVLLSGAYPDNSNGLYLVQECLRTNALKYAFNNDWIPYGQIYFTMIAILSKPDRFPDVVAEAVDFTQGRLGVEKSRIKLRSTRNHTDLNSVHSIVDLQTEYDSKPEKYYHWSYGIEGVYGRGLTVCIFNPATEKWFDVGNVVKIHAPDGTELGTEFGYGNEFLLTAIVGVDEALKFSKIYEVYEFEKGLSQKYYSTLEAIVRIKAAGGQIGHRGVGHIYKQYLKSLQFIGATLGKDINEIIFEMSKYADFIGISELQLYEEFDFINTHKKRKEEFANIIKRVGANLWDKSKNRQPKEFIDNPIELINNYLDANGVDKAEVLDILEKLDRFNILNNG